MLSSQIRTGYLKHFEKHGHKIVPSSALVPNNDPSLMFTVAGMVQFKDVFLSKEVRDYSRATTAQKCLRVGGKHNDLDNVGFTDRHLTFFEMLGNFSFGDYFKRDALNYAWELITEEFALPKDRLWATVYSEDDEAYDIWTKDIGLSKERVVRIGDNKGRRYLSDNFWMMGDTGPCGPCSEIFFDYGPNVAGGPPGSPTGDGDRYVEIWNNVFMQYERQADGGMTKLLRPSVDTGMGLERISAVMQGKSSIWDTDLLRSLIEVAANQTNTDPDGPMKGSLRVVADHVRASAFLLAEGVLPSNEGRSYVLRRIMRRGMRHAHLLGADDPLMHKLVPTLVQQMGSQYGELKQAQPLITEALRTEESRFKNLLERGLRLLDDETSKLSSGATLPGEVAFKLYDTYGFPLDLTEDVLKSQGRAVDTAGFTVAMSRQKAEARRGWVGSGDTATGKQWFDLKEELGATEFLGYDTLRSEAVVTAILKRDQRLTSAQASDGEVIVVTNQTPFYGAGGGQVGDSGGISAGDSQFRVSDTQKQLGLHLHIGSVTNGTLTLGSPVTMSVDADRRAAISANHTATHLLHAALREHLGPHVTQKGSLVDNERLRFDFTHPKPMTTEDVAAIERIVNERILMNAPVEIRHMSQAEALSAGAMALFGEKYGDEVRVLSMGGTREGGKAWSLELCGGTHVLRTGSIGLFKLVGENAVSAGVRRVEALTGVGALAYFNKLEHLAQSASHMLGVSIPQVPERIAQLVGEQRELAREARDLRHRLAMQGEAGTPTSQLRNIAGTKLDARIVELPARDLKPIADGLKNQIGSGVVVLISTLDSKASIVVGVTPDLTARFNAVDLARSAAEQCGGKGGGGRPDMAQAGGPDGSKAKLAVETIANIISSRPAAVFKINQTPPQP